LDAGATTTETFTWSAQAGPHTFKAEIDSDGSIAETDETNNEKVVTFSSTTLSDLIVQDITWTPSNPSIGDTITFTVTIKNQGSGSSHGSYVNYYLDGSSSRFDYDSVSSLDAGATTTTTFTWCIGRNVEGEEHTIRSVIDLKNAVQEINENNNEKEVSLIITKIYTYADLTITVKDSRNSNPLKSAEVYIDDDLVGRTYSDGKITEKVAEEEKHLIKVVKSDYYSKIETVDVGYDVSAKEVTIVLDYAKVPITIYVEDENRDAVSNAEVFLDSNSIGITDIEGEVKALVTKNKDILIKVVKSGYYSEDVLVHVGSYHKRFLINLKREDKTVPNILIENMEIVGDNDDILEVGESIKITYSVKDDSGIKDIKCKLDGKLIDSYTTAGNYSTTTPKLTIGTHVIKFEAIDADINPHKSVKDVSITVSEKGPTVLFQSTKNTISRGENAVFTLGALNPIGRKNMTIELILKAPSGVSVSGISFVKSGGGMYQATYEIEPGEGMKFITVDIIGNELGIHKIEAEVHYSVPGGEVLTQYEKRYL
jgi:hypothetical protein